MPYGYGVPGGAQSLRSRPCFVAMISNMAAGHCFTTTFSSDTHVADLFVHSSFISIMVEQAAAEGRQVSSTKLGAEGFATTRHGTGWGQVSVVQLDCGDERPCLGADGHA